MHRRIFKAVSILTLAALLLTGCTSEASSIGNAKEKDGEIDVVDTGFQVSAVGSFDSADTAVVLSTDLNNKAVTLINMDTGKQYTLYYDGTTYVQDKHDGPMTISQIKAGDVVDVTFLKGKKKLASIKRSPEAWVYDSVYNYDLAGSNKTASIGSQTYSLPDGVVVLSEGHRVEAGEVVSQDVVTISGIDHKIYSVNVDRGHGYLRLKNDQPLLGGWIEVGNRVIRQITEDMLLVVPEGSYEVTLTNNNVGCVKNVTVERDKEVVLDVSDLEVAEDAVGRILFTVTPESAKVSVDGKPVDISKVVELPYGIHQVQAEASGYDTLTKHIQVGSEYATISFKLEESRQTDSSKNSVSENSTSRIPWKDTLDTVETNKPSVSDNTLSTLSENALGTSNNYKVYIDSPKGVEVYLDGNYVGLSPVRFTKTVGRHEITLKKNGYKTKTYTIYLENTRQDETYSFSALEKESSGGSGNSGNKGDDDKDKTTSKSTGEAPLPSGKVKFTVIPDTAKITVDGKSVGIGEEIELAYGTHTVLIEAEGYESISENIVVEEAVKECPYTLKLKKEPENPSQGSTENPSGGTTGTPPTPPQDPDDENQGGGNEGDNTGSGTDSGSGGGTGSGTDSGSGGSAGSGTGSGSGGGTGSGTGSESGGGTGAEPGGGSSGDTGNKPDDTKDETGSGDASGDINGETGGNTGNQTEGDNSEKLNTEKVTINQNAHPIRKFFSSLFK